MNSMILSAAAVFFTGLAERFHQSGTYALFCRIYNAVSRCWQASAIVSGFKAIGNHETAEQSVLYKIVHLPFTFLEFLQRTLGKWLAGQMEHSCILYWGKTFLQNFIALNTRFFGMMLLGGMVSYQVLRLVQRGSVSVPVLFVGVLGVLLMLVNYNVMGFFNGSKVIEFCKKAAGFEALDFNFFTSGYLQGNTRLVLAALVGIGAGVLLGVSPLLAVALPFGIFGLAAVLYTPVAGVYFAVFAAPFVPTMVLAGLCVLSAFSLAVRTLTMPGFRWRVGGVGVGLLFFLGLLLVSCLTCFAPVNSTLVWAMYLVFVGFYFVIINTIKTKEQLYGLLKVFVIAGAFVALYGVLQYVFGWNTNNAWIDENMFEDATMRVYSTLENPNVLGEYLLLVLPVAAVFMLYFKPKSLAKWVYIAVFLLLALCLVLTQSRGCWIGFLLAAVLFVTFYNGRWWGILPVILVLLPFIVPQSIVERVMSIGNMEDSSTSYRVFIWMGTLAMLRHYWLGGIGMGEVAFNKVYPFYSYNAIIAPHSHNLYLQLLVEAGICGLIVFVVILFIFFKRMSNIYIAEKKRSLDSMISLAIASGAAGFLVQSMFDYTFYNYRVMAMFFMFMAFGIALWYMVRKGEQRV